MKIKAFSKKVIDIFLIVLLFYFCTMPIIGVILNGISGEGPIATPTRWQVNMTLLQNSLRVSLIVTIIAVVFATTATITLNRIKFRGRNILKVMMLLPLVNPAFVGSISFIMLFGRRGLITYRLLGLNTSPYGIQGIIVLQSLAFTTLAYLIISSGIRNIDTTIEDAARNLGASETSVFFRITLSTIWPEIITAALLVFLASMADFTTPLIIGGSFRTLASDLYLQITGLYNLQSASVTGIILFIPCFIAFILHRYVISKKRYTDASASSTIEYQEIAKPIKYVAIFISSITVIFFLVNVTFIIVGAFTVSWGFDYTFTLTHLRTAVDQDFNKLLRPLLNSFTLAIVTAFISSFIGVMLAYRIERKTIVAPKVVDFICLFTSAVPGVLFGIGYLVIFKYSFFGVGQAIFKSANPIILLGTGIIIYIICIARSVNLSMKSCYALLKHVDPDLENAAYNLGAGKLRTLIYIILPVLKDAFVNSFIRVFSSTMTTLGAIVFLLMPANKVIIQVIFQAITGANLGATAVMALMLSSFTLMCMLTFYFLAYGKNTITRIRRKVTWK